MKLLLTIRRPTPNQKEVAMTTQSILGPFMTLILTLTASARNTAATSRTHHRREWRTASFSLNS